ncbi:opacity protein-like surface antigen [Bartonella fuyuanensis]|uniref:Porin n=1 Tax=Bartonella fuyuanensis TaxID=1460968 RepID=A0A840DSU4_9HYPH|nr:outer membrane protein [Bartonella fuyuanensis]MBB4076124.1 opacity protein-like surface antigen [Bartonella fuyuanensis]
MNTKFITASVFSLVSSSIVQAADVVAREELVHGTAEVVASSPFSWAGFYFGGQVGGFSSKISALMPDGDIPLYPDEASKSKTWVSVEKQYVPDLSGFVGGLYAGINFDLGNNFIVGIDSDILLTEKKNTKTILLSEKKNTKTKFQINESGAVGLGTEGTDTEHKSHKRVSFDAEHTEEIEEKDNVAYNHTLKQKWTGATRMRVGFSAHRVMPYIAGGVTYGKFQDVMSVVFAGSEPLKAISDATETMIGYTLGGGVDFAMADNLVLRAEYRYSDFGKKKFKDDIEVKYKTNDFRAGIAYKF